MVSTQELNYTTQISSIVLYTITFTCSYREVSLTWLKQSHLWPKMKQQSYKMTSQRDTQKEVACYIHIYKFTYLNPLL